MKNRRLFAWVDRHGREMVIAASSRGDFEERYEAAKTDALNGMTSILQDHEGRITDLEKWRKKASRYIRATGRPKK